MQIPSAQAQIRAANLPVEKLAGDPRLSEAEKLDEASRQFEAVLVRQILKEAQRPAFPSAIHPRSATADIYHDMVATGLADAISQSRGIGLADTLARQLGAQLQIEPAAGEPAHER